MYPSVFKIGDGRSLRDTLKIMSNRRRVVAEGGGAKKGEKFGRNCKVECMREGLRHRVEGQYLEKAYWKTRDGGTEVRTEHKFRPRKGREGCGCFGMVRQHLYRWATSRSRTFAAAERYSHDCSLCWLLAVGSWQLDGVGYVSI